MKEKLKLKKFRQGELSLTLKVDASALLRRVRVGMWIIRLGCRVVGIGFNVELVCAACGHDAHRPTLCGNGTGAPCPCKVGGL